jgi:hypothetical protein
MTSVVSYPSNFLFGLRRDIAGLLRALDVGTLSDADQRHLRFACGLIFGQSCDAGDVAAGLAIIQTLATGR